MPVYLDHNATTRLDPRVLDAMLPYLTEAFGNPSSAHAFGRTARAALDEAHERLAGARTRHGHLLDAKRLRPARRVDADGPHGRRQPARRRVRHRVAVGRRACRGARRLASPWLPFGEPLPQR